MLSTPIIVACILVMVTAAFLLIVQKTSANVIPGATKYTNREPTFIIAGLPNMGKTSLFNLLTTDSNHATVMSQEPNIAADHTLCDRSNTSRYYYYYFYYYYLVFAVEEAAVTAVTAAASTCHFKRNIINCNTSEPAHQKVITRRIQD